MANVAKRPLGKSGIQVTPIGLGTLDFAGGGGLIGKVTPVIPQEEKNDIVKAAIDGGVNWFDTWIRCLRSKSSSP